MVVASRYRPDMGQEEGNSGDGHGIGRGRGSDGGKEEDSWDGTPAENSTM